MSSNPPVVTRFAPSPTGFLHIGGARTALFNWLFARHNNGKFLLRIEDTDRARSTPEATEAILDGLNWLGLDWDGDFVSQAERASRHVEVANEMQARGHAYRCYSTTEEITAFREKARAEGKPPLFRSPWRDTDQAPPADTPYVIRLKAPQTGETTVHDLVQGDVTWKNETLDDLILVRSDMTPTYMHAVVVDDHDMGVTHVIRGDDHLTNAARQTLIYNAMGWTIPQFAHIPLIHGPDGAKLSKRHGALGVDAYRDMGYLPAAMRNYLARLGWSHGDDEFFTTEQAVEWFGLDRIGKSPARFDFSKLEHLSGQHFRVTEGSEIMPLLENHLASHNLPALSDLQRSQLLSAMPGIRERAKTIPQAVDLATFILGSRPFLPDDKAQKALSAVSRGMLARLTSLLQHATWKASELEMATREVAVTNGIGMGKIAQAIRVALTGKTISPSVFDMMEILGRDETLARIEECMETMPADS